jgi:hypothetical protein
MIEHVKINIRERRRSNTMQRNWQHMVRNTKKNTEKLATYGTQDEEKHRETGNIWYARRRKTQRNWQHMVRKTKKNTEKLATYGTQDEEKQSKNTTHCVLDTTMNMVFLLLLSHN